MHKWQRYKFLPVLPLGEDGKIVTGSKAHIALSRKTAAEGMVLGLILMMLKVKETKGVDMGAIRGDEFEGK